MSCMSEARKHSCVETVCKAKGKVKTEREGGLYWGREQESTWRWREVQAWRVQDGGSFTSVTPRATFCNSLLPKYRAADTEQDDSSDRNYWEQCSGGEYKPEAFQEGSKNQRRPETSCFVLKTPNTKALATFNFNMLRPVHHFPLFPFFAPNFSLLCFKHLYNVLFFFLLRGNCSINCTQTLSPFFSPVPFPPVVPSLCCWLTITFSCGREIGPFGTGDVGGVALPAQANGWGWH